MAPALSWRPWTHAYERRQRNKIPSSMSTLQGYLVVSRTRAGGLTGAEIRDGVLCTHHFFAANTVRTAVEIQSLGQSGTIY
jgi:hypothetical protein